MSSQLAAETEGPLEELAQRFAAICESAVDPLEVASALEFDGVSDRAARTEYEVPDVFTLARLLYARVPRRPAPPATEPDPWQASHPLLHGLLYALPAVCFPAVGALLAGPGVLPALVIALLSGWGLSQGLAAVGYLRLGASGAAHARRGLRDGLACCLVAVALIMTATALTVHARLPVFAFGAGEAAYMLGACVLLVTGAERWLPAALAPGVTGATVFLVLGMPAQLEYQTWAALAATPVVACAIAAAHTMGAWPRRRGAPSQATGAPSPATDARSRAGRLKGGELLGALPAAALGVIAGGLLSFPVVAGVSGHGGGNVGALMASVPLALSMGAAEWCLLRYRRATRRLLWLTDDTRWFRGRAGLLLLGALGQYLFGTIMLVSLALGVALLSSQVTLGAVLLLSVGGYLVLGAAMFLVLLLQTMRIRLVPLAAAAATLGVELALRRHGLAVQVAAPSALLVAVGGYALARLGAAVLHA
jgi:hypothetical protein